MSDERIQLILDLGDSKKNVAEVREALEKLDAAAGRTGDGLDKIDDGAKKAGKSTADFGRSALETGRIVQDFAQGGLGGIINNLEGFTRAVGLGPGAAGAMTLLGVAALTAAPAIKALWREIVDGSNDVPKSTDALKNLNDALATNRTRLKELAEQGKLTNAELAEFNKLTVESNRLEKEATAEKERRNAAEAARKQKSPEQSDLGTAFTKISGGADYDKLVSAASGVDGPTTEYLGLRREYDALREKRQGGAGFSPEEAARFAELSGRMNKLAAGNQLAINDPETARKTTEAQDLVNKARGGDYGALDELLSRTTGDVRDKLNSIDPRKQGMRDMSQDAAKRQIGDAIGDVVNPIVTGLKDRRAAEKQGIDHGKIIDEQQERAGKEDARGAKEIRDREWKEKLDNAEAIKKGPVKEKPLPMQDMIPLTKLDEVLGQQADAVAGNAQNMNRMADRLSQISRQYDQAQRNIDTLPSILDFGQA